MSDKEKRIAEGITKLPDPLKDRFLDQIQGAVLALDMMGAANPKGKEEGKEADNSA